MRNTFSLYIYNTAGSVTNTSLFNYGPLLEEVKFSTIAPGGFGDMTCKLRVHRSRIIPPEIKIFSHVALLDGFNRVFLGRLDEPNTGIDKAEGDIITLTALGASHVLQDDPQDFAYTAQTTTQILTDQIVTQRSAYLPIDSDFTQVLPNAPATTFSPAFQGKNIEEILNELTNDLGDYQWAIWDHPRNKDAYGFPTWQLYWHLRTFALANPTPNYIATLANQISHDVKGSVEYSYNCVTLMYRDFTSTNPQSVTVQDSRLAANKSQGTAPFPFRRLRKDVSEALLTATQATALANVLLAQYQNGGFKVTFDVAAMTDANGSPIPLHTVRADGIVLVPDLAPLGQKLSTTYVPNVNLFYITETQYEMLNGQTPKLTLICNSYYDTTSFQLARLQRTNEHHQKNRKHHGIIQAKSETETGPCGALWGANAVSTDTYGESVNFKTTLNSAPASITLTATASTNANAPTTAFITTTGFHFQIQPTANGAGKWQGNYKATGT